MDKIYIQTYSVIRDYMQDFRGTMKRIAEVGYETGVVKGVAAGTCVITVKASGNANYEEAAATLTVTVKKAAKKVSPDGKPLTIKKAPTLAAKQKLIKK